MSHDVPGRASAVRRAAPAVLAAGILLSACSGGDEDERAEQSIEGPRPLSLPTYRPSGFAHEALGGGYVVVRGDCVLLSPLDPADGEARSLRRARDLPTWPRGTEATIDADGAVEITTPEGVVISSGDRISAGGGWLGAPETDPQGCAAEVGIEDSFYVMSRVDVEPRR